MHQVFLLLLFTIANAAADCTPSITRASGTHAPKKRYCSGELIFEDNFDQLYLKKWRHENTLSGGGNWQFQWYTNNRGNSYAENGTLKIRPTLTADFLGVQALYAAQLDINAPTPDECTNAHEYGCFRTGSASNILNPVRSAELRSVNSFSFCFGRVEIRAKLPRGDWLWPAIRLIPRHSRYGMWPASGQFDIIESRGNDKIIVNGVNIGLEQVGVNLHWGPAFGIDKYVKSHATRNNQTDYGSEYHLYELIWTNTSITFRLDNTDMLTMSPPAGGFWELGKFNLGPRDNPWRFGSRMAPFDQEFFFGINLAVGGISGYFPDAPANPSKTWTNTSPRAATDFWNGRNRWLPTWDQKGDNSTFQIDYIRVYAI